MTSRVPAEFPCARRVGGIADRVQETLSLDDTPGRVIVSEHNIDEWPNAGLSPLPGQPRVFSYGFIPPGLFAQIKARFLAHMHPAKAAGCVAVDPGRLWR